MPLTLDPLACSVEASCSVRASQLVFRPVIAAENMLLILVAIAVMSASVRGWPDSPVTLTSHRKQTDSAL